MNISIIFKNAILNLYHKGIYSVDFAIIKASELSDKNKINANDYEELITYLAEEQAKEMTSQTEEIPTDEVPEESKEE